MRISRSALAILASGISIGVVLTVIAVLYFGATPKSITIGPVEFELPTTISSHRQIAASTETALPDGMLLFDDFEKENSAKWIDGVGSSRIQNGEVHIADGGLYLAGSESWDNYSIRAKVRLVTGDGDFSLVARYMDDSRLYLCQLCNSEVSVTKYGTNLSEGNFERLTRKPYEFHLGEVYDFRMDVYGNQITCYLNGEVVGPAVDRSYQTGKLGFRVGNTEAAIDSVEVFTIP